MLDLLLDAGSSVAVAVGIVACIILSVVALSLVGDWLSRRAKRSAEERKP